MNKPTKQLILTAKDKRPLVLPRRVFYGECKATTEEGRSCQAYVVFGQAFCRVHLAQGYALFTLAALNGRASFQEWRKGR